MTKWIIRYRCSWDSRNHYFSCLSALCSVTSTRSSTCAGYIDPLLSWSSLPYQVVLELLLVCSILDLSTIILPSPGLLNRLIRTQTMCMSANEIYVAPQFFCQCLDMSSSSWWHDRNKRRDCESFVLRKTRRCCYVLGEVFSQSYQVLTITFWHHMTQVCETSCK